MGSQWTAGGFPKAGHDVDDSVREASLNHKFAEPQCRERRLFSRLHDDAVTAGECRTEFPGSHQEREIPRNNLTDYADGFAQGECMKFRAGRVRDTDWDRIAFDLRGPTG